MRGRQMGQIFSSFSLAAPMPIANNLTSTTLDTTLGSCTRRPQKGDLINFRMGHNNVSAKIFLVDDTMTRFSAEDKTGAAYNFARLQNGWVLDVTLTFDEIESEEE